MIFRKRIMALLVVLVVTLSISVCVNAAETGAVTGAAGSYDTIKAAVAAATAGDTLTLHQDMTEDVIIRKNLTLDLNGHSINGTVTVSASKVVSVKDTSTDDFTSADGYGTVKATAGTGKVKAAEGYIAIAEAGGTSYHRLDLQISSVTLRPGVAGIYFGSNYGGDEAVKAQVKTYGIVMSLAGAPTEKEIAADKTYSTHTAFSGDSWVCGTTGKAYGTLLQNIMKPANTPEANAKNAATNIYSVSYVELKDGSYALGTPVTLNLQNVAEQIDTIWSSLTSAQATAMNAMFRSYESVMENWSTDNQHNSLHSQVYIDYTRNSDGTVTAKFSADGDVALAMMELQLDMQLKNATYGSYEILATGSADANCVGNTFYFSLMSASDMDITGRTDLFSITFQNVAQGAEIIFRVKESIVSDGAFTDIRSVCIAGAKYSG